jgi:tetratricopeptide (TPR) repeat protein
MLRNLSFLLIYLIFSFFAVAQDEQSVYSDSLIKVYSTSKEDTIKIEALLKLSELYYRTNPDTLVELCEKALKIIDKKLKSKPTPREKEIFLVNKGSAYANLAVVQEDRGNLKKSLEYNNISLAVYKSVNYYSGVSTVLNNMGKIMKMQGEFEEAINLYTESIKYADLCDNIKGKAYTIGNIGAIHYANGNNNAALECFIKAKVMHKEVNDIFGLTISLNNIGSVYRNLNMLDLALKSYNETYQLCLQNGDLKQQSNSTLKMSIVYGLQKDIQNAIKYGNIALIKSMEGQSGPGVLKAYKNLYDIYKKTNKPQIALDFYEKYVILKDSLNTEENQKAIIEQRIQLDYDRKLIADSIKFEESKKAELAVKNIEI